MLPDRVAFSEILLEVCRWTGFADAFTHISEGRARVEDLHVSVGAVLLAEGCNISLQDVTQPSVPALAYGRLAWVSQNYVHAETIAAANDLLLPFHARIPLVGAFGGGDIATVDGMRFRVPVRTIHADPNPRYFATGRGVTWLNYMSGVPEHEDVQGESKCGELVFLALAVGLAQRAAVAVEDHAADGVATFVRLTCTPMSRRYASLSTNASR
jgi:hypothetical protein